MTIDVYTLWIFVAGALAGVGITLLAHRIPDFIATLRHIKRRPRLWAQRPPSLLDTPAAIEVLKIIRSAKRPMPAHFNGDGSFLIDPALFRKDDEPTMAHEAWGSVNQYAANLKHLTKAEFGFLVRIGEDVMLTAYLLSRRGHGELAEKVTQVIIADRLWETEASDTLDIRKLEGDDSATAYLQHCMEFGRHRARIPR
jgi:hypothetical protein